jgi:hypothetical protein
LNATNLRNCDWENFDKISEFIFGCLLVIHTLLFSESFVGEHEAISSDHHVSVVPAIISYVVPKQERLA